MAARLFSGWHRFSLSLCQKRTRRAALFRRPRYACVLLSLYLLLAFQSLCESHTPPRGPSFSLPSSTFFSSLFPRSKTLPSYAFVGSTHDGDAPPKLISAAWAAGSHAGAWPRGSTPAATGRPWEDRGSATDGEERVSTICNEQLRGMRERWHLPFLVSAGCRAVHHEAGRSFGEASSKAKRTSKRCALFSSLPCLLFPLFLASPSLSSQFSNLPTTPSLCSRMSGERSQPRCETFVTAARSSRLLWKSSSRLSDVARHQLVLAAHNNWPSRYPRLFAERSGLPLGRQGTATFALPFSLPLLAAEDSRTLLQRTSQTPERPRGKCSQTRCGGGASPSTSSTTAAAHRGSPGERSPNEHASGTLCRQGDEQERLKRLETPRGPMGPHPGGGDTKSKKAPFSDTVLLPVTKFRLKSNNLKTEEAVQRLWRSQQVYERLLRRATPPVYLLLDGPPYANGDAHMGHALNKALKDFVTRFFLLRRRCIHMLPGWDCHGLPIELKAAAQLEETREKEIDVKAMRRQARRIAEEAIESQKRDFQRFGVWAHWEKPYLTYDRNYEATELEMFRRMWRVGFVYEGVRPVFWSPSARTALADAEVEHLPRVSRSLYCALALELSSTALHAKETKNGDGRTEEDARSSPAGAETESLAKETAGRTKSDEGQNRRDAREFLTSAFTSFVPCEEWEGAQSGECGAAKEACGWEPLCRSPVASPERVSGADEKQKHLRKGRVEEEGVSQSDETARTRHFAQIALLVWTTTPYTLPANHAVAVHGERPYALVEILRPVCGDATRGRIASLAAEATPVPRDRAPANAREEDSVFPQELTEPVPRFPEASGASAVGAVHASDSADEVAASSAGACASRTSTGAREFEEDGKRTECEPPPTETCTREIWIVAEEAVERTMKALSISRFGTIENPTKGALQRRPCGADGLAETVRGDPKRIATDVVAEEAEEVTRDRVAERRDDACKQGTKEHRRETFFRVLGRISGKDLVGKRYAHPMLAHQTREVIRGDSLVREQKGTGLVHVAPGHGFDDFVLVRDLLGQKKRDDEAATKSTETEPLDKSLATDRTNAVRSQTSACSESIFPSPVDEVGKFTSDVGVDELRGLEVFGEGESRVIQLLQRNGVLVKEVPFPHSYPHDWRTKQPLICRTTSQVFLRLDRIRDVALDRIKRVHFMPYSGQIPQPASLADIPCFPSSAYTRMQAALESRQGDWCLSRQRQWGLPLPFFRLQRGGAEPAAGHEPCRTGGEAERVQGVAQSREPSEEPLFGDTDTFEAIARKIREEGSDAWWTSPHPASWLPPQHRNVAASLSPVSDTFDIWFDAGCAWKPARDFLRFWMDTTQNGEGENATEAGDDADPAWQERRETDLSHAREGGGACASKQQRRKEEKEIDIKTIVVEGTDQHRGWFQALMLTHAAMTVRSADAQQRGALTRQASGDCEKTRENEWQCSPKRSEGGPRGSQEGEDATAGEEEEGKIKTHAGETRETQEQPFDIVVTHGFVLDGKGRKMSKSLHNVFSPRLFFPPRSSLPVKKVPSFHRSSASLPSSSASSSSSPSSSSSSSSPSSSSPSSSSSSSSSPSSSSPSLSSSSSSPASPSSSSLPPPSSGPCFASESVASPVSSPSLELPFYGADVLRLFIAAANYGRDLLLHVPEPSGESTSSPSSSRGGHGASLSSSGSSLSSCREGAAPQGEAASRRESTRGKRENALKRSPAGTPLDQAASAYGKLRGSLRFLLGNLQDFLPRRDAICDDKLPFLDRALLRELEGLVDQTTQAYELFDFSRAIRGVLAFLADPFSSFYLEVAKDRLYVSARDSFRRRSCQTVLAIVFLTLVKLVAPIVPHLSEEAFLRLPRALRDHVRRFADRGDTDCKGHGQGGNAFSQARARRSGFDETERNHEENGEKNEMGSTSGATDVIDCNREHRGEKPPFTSLFDTGWPRLHLRSASPLVPSGNSDAESRERVFEERGAQRQELEDRRPSETDHEAAALWQTLVHMRRETNRLLEVPRRKNSSKRVTDRSPESARRDCRRGERHLARRQGDTTTTEHTSRGKVPASAAEKAKEETRETPHKGQGRVEEEVRTRCDGRLRITTTDPLLYRRLLVFSSSSPLLRAAEGDGQTVPEREAEKRQAENRGTEMKDTAGEERGGDRERARQVAREGDTGEEARSAKTVDEHGATSGRPPRPGREKAGSAKQRGYEREDRRSPESEESLRVVPDVDDLRWMLQFSQVEVVLGSHESRSQVGEDDAKEQGEDCEHEQAAAALPFAASASGTVMLELFLASGRRCSRCWMRSPLVQGAQEAGSFDCFAVSPSSSSQSVSGDSGDGENDPSSPRLCPRCVEAIAANQRKTEKGGQSRTAAESALE
ncbi:UNVERIFIED_CONTAM: isoleucyl-tRNA synthetase, putative [Hammondia hammondi]|eukprot:XP_008888720.1 isoleucyl-tRNA synthetase, putative [Hammondia hammondi]